MNVRLLIQKNGATGETNLTILTDPTVDPEDETLRMGSWAEAPPILKDCLLLADDESLDLLGRHSFRSTENSRGEEPVECDAYAVRRAVEYGLAPDEGPLPPIGL